MQLIDAYRSAWSNCLNYDGRSNRSDYWWFVLANLIVALILLRIANPLYNIYSVASLVPGIAISVRRLRDIGKPWPWLFIGLIPIVGSIWLIVLFCQPSVAG